ncbi:hypothetical protein DW1_2306 [Proteiniborus sp. DW1]|uniref:C39 family peptidase n=1 Tax=Proteiniborus sp. DW1 TaxID=1889883 RepID=UPI00092DED0E|nr:C39 family peptidase [Proteiniborus sp. DW1]SCG83870.1 hypothetical protein DW1_2306 [Proteiniborus sp. DW1]
MIKRYIAILLMIMIISTSGIPVVFANTEYRRNDNYEIEDYAPVIGDFQYDSEYAAKIARKEQKAKEYYRAKMSGNSILASSILSEIKATYDEVANEPEYSLVPLYSGKRLAIYQVPQEKDYWCGYAAIKSLLDYENINKSQSVIAEEVYDRYSSCPWYISNGNSRDQFPVPNYLTDEIGFYYVPYPYGEAGTTNIEASDIDWRIVSTIDSDHGLVVCGISYGNIKGHESILPGYPARKIGHWLAIDGYKLDGDEIWIVDPAKSDEVSFSDNISAYYSITSTKLAAYAKSKGIVW